MSNRCRRDEGRASRHQSVGTRKNYPAEVAILGEPKTTLPEMTEALLAARSVAEAGLVGQRLAQARAEGISSLARLNANAEALSERHPIHPLALMQAIGRVLPADAVVIDETVSSGAGLRRFLKSDDPQSFFGMRGGGIGWGLRRRSGPSWRCRTGRWWRCSATARRCTRSRGCGRRRGKTCAWCS